MVCVMKTGLSSKHSGGPHVFTGEAGKETGQNVTIQGVLGGD